MDARSARPGLDYSKPSAGLLRYGKASSMVSVTFTHCELKPTLSFCQQIQGLPNVYAQDRPSRQLCHQSTKA